MITSDEQISPPSLVCEEYSLHLHSLCMGILSNLLPWDILLCKTSQLYNSKRGLVEKFAHLT